VLFIVKIQIKLSTAYDLDCLADYASFQRSRSIDPIRQSFGYFHAISLPA
jgi:hypothetical protein